jgi:hypothetical protein
MKRRAYGAMVLGGLAVVALLVILVWRIGQRDPSPPSLADHPRDEVLGTVAYADTRGCINVVNASGRNRRQISCPGAVYALTWINGETIAYDVGGRWREVDVGSGADRTDSYFVRPASSVTSRKGETVSFDANGSVFVENGRRTKVLDFSGPPPQPRFVTWSPDGEWLLLSYEPKDELWIVRRDGTLSGTLADNANPSGWGPGGYGDASWWIDGAGAQP